MGKCPATFPARMAFAALVLGVALLGVLAPAAAHALESPNPSSTELVEQPRRWDGRDVTFTGEAVGEAMVRGGGAWLHLNDDAYIYGNITEGTPLGGFNSGMPIWVPAELARSVTTFGDYRNSGDVVRVEGFFNAACAQHGGDMDIHAATLAIVKPGHEAPDPTNPRKQVLALLLALAAAALWLANRRAVHKG